MTQYLLAAEADKIQDFIFRSSRLREVVGASQLLTRFCREGVPELCALYEEELTLETPVNDGGSFRIVFTGDDEAKLQASAARFGADLAELYRLSVDGALSVAQPVPIPPEATSPSMAQDPEPVAPFVKANKDAGKALRRAKEHRQGAVAEAHMPFVAFCASCGVALADHYGRLAGERGERSRYLCRSCRYKADERAAERQEWLGDFIAAVRDDAQPAWQAWLTAYQRDIMDAQGVADFICPRDADDAAAHDSRHYVAYLVADGNGMGEIFGQCNQEQIEKLSKGLTATVRACLAEPTRLFLQHNPPKIYQDECQVKHAMIPVLPLILGGDDVFVLLPAPYALDFAHRFCQAYEDKVGRLLDEVFGRRFTPRPTVSAAVVICKSKYPYALAHRRAETLLKAAKRRAKRRAKAQQNEPDAQRSIVNFEVILGNRLVGQAEDAQERARVMRPSLRPYWVSPSEAQGTGGEWGVDLGVLLDQRYALRNLPQRRLILLRKHFDELWSEYVEPISSGSAAHRGHRALVDATVALERIRLRSGKTQGQTLATALTRLGKALDDGPRRHYWRSWRDSPRESLTLAQGLPDLIEAWDYALSLDRAPAEYEPREEDEA